MIIQVAVKRFIEDEIKYFNIESEKHASECGVDIEWLKKENLTGTICIPADTLLAQYYACLIGAVYGHRGFNDGDVIRTSTIQMIVHYKNDTYVFTRNSVYEVIAK